MAAEAPSPAPAPALMEEIVEEILIRLPPTEPENLVRAALVCKPWCRLISGRAFRRRLREFHHAPPMLGLVCNRVDENFYSDYLARFVPTCSFRPRRTECRDWRALDARHGRVLLRVMASWPRHLAVWDPVTDEWTQLPKGPELVYDWNAAVLCAACGTGACDHLDCHCGHFLVVFLGTGGVGAEHMTLWIYSSEAGTWSEPTFIVQFPKYYMGNVDVPPSAIVGNALYFLIDSSRRILKYDLATREINVLLQLPGSDRSCATIVTLEDGGLGVARMEGPRLFLWSMAANTDGGMGWTQIRAIDLPKILSVDADRICPDFLGFAHGAGVIFVGTGVGLFSFDLKSGQVKMVCEGGCHFNGIRGVVPFMSFHTRALGAVSTDD